MLLLIHIFSIVSICRCVCFSGWDGFVRHVRWVCVYSELRWWKRNTTDTRVPCFRCLEGNMKIRSTTPVVEKNNKNKTISGEHRNIHYFISLVWFHLCVESNKLCASHRRFNASLSHISFRKRGSGGRKKTIRRIFFSSFLFVLTSPFIIYRFYCKRTRNEKSMSGDWKLFAYWLKRCSETLMDGKRSPRWFHSTMLSRRVVLNVIIDKTSCNLHKQT